MITQFAFAGDAGTTAPLLPILPAGPPGRDGAPGAAGGAGQPGRDGAAGLSTYDIWLAQPGNAGKTVAQFLASLAPLGAVSQDDLVAALLPKLGKTDKIDTTTITLSDGSVVVLPAALAKKADLFLNLPGGPTAVDVRNQLPLTFDNFGAKSDAVALTANCSLAAGSAVLSVSGAAFTQADIGKIIGISTVPTAGTQSVTPWQQYATITSVVSSAQVTVNIAAPATNNGFTGPLTGQSCNVVYGTNNSAAIQNALNWAKTTGRKLVIPDTGTGYVVGESCKFYDGLRLEGLSARSMVFMAGMPGTQGAELQGFLIPAAAIGKGVLDPAAPYATTKSLGYVCRDIQFRDFNLITTGVAYGNSSKAIVFALCQRAHALNVGIFCPGVAVSGLSWVGCDDCLSWRCQLIGVAIGLDHWKGCSRIRDTDNQITLSANIAGQAQAINYNGCGTNESEPNASVDIACERNRIVLNGAVMGVKAIYLDGLGPGSRVDKVRIVGNWIYGASGTKNQGILARGSGGKHVIADNYFVNIGDPSSGVPVIVTGAGGDPTATPLTNPLTTSSGSSTVQVAWPNHGLTADGVANGVWITTPPLTLGGLTFKAAFPYQVIAVTDANNVTIQFSTGSTSPTATATANGGTGSYARHWGTAAHCRITNNTLEDPQCAGLELIRIQGNGHYVDGNAVALNSGAPTYATHVSVSTPVDDGSECTIGELIGPAGVGGLAGFTGDGFFAWNGFRAPRAGSLGCMVVDPTTTGGSVYMVGNVGWLHLTAASAQSAVSIFFPKKPRDNDELVVTTVTQITQMFVSTQDGSTIDNGSGSNAQVAPLTTNPGARWRFNGTTKVWRRLF